MALSSLSSTNVANSLLQTLNVINKGEIVISKETLEIVNSLIQICTVLADSASSIQEITLNDKDKSSIIQYCSTIKSEKKNLLEVKTMLEQNPKNPAIKPKLIATAKVIALTTSEMITSENNPHIQKITDQCRTLAGLGKAVIEAITCESAESFITACREFVAQNTAIMHALRAFARDCSYTELHKRKMFLMAEKLKELGSRLIRTCHSAFDDSETAKSIDTAIGIGKELARLISQTITVIQLDGEIDNSRLSVNSPTVPITSNENLQDRTSQDRAPTVKDPKQATDILRKVREASITTDIRGELDEVIKTVKPRTSSRRKQNEDADIQKQEEIKKIIEENEKKRQSGAMDNLSSDWKERCFQLERELQAAREEVDVLRKSIAQIQEVCHINLKKK